jgi:hypothetical protein
MPTLPNSLNDYIIKTKERLNQSNLKTYCKCCIEALGEEEGKKIFFPNKTDRIIQHLKKCTHFFTLTTSEIRDEILSLSRSNSEKQPEAVGKRSCKFELFFFFFFYILIY